MIFSPHFDGEGSSSHPLNTRPTSSTSRFAYKGPFLERLLLPLSFLFFSFLFFFLHIHIQTHTHTHTHTLTFSTHHQPPHPPHTTLLSFAHTYTYFTSCSVRSLVSLLFFLLCAYPVLFSTVPTPSSNLALEQTSAILLLSLPFLLATLLPLSTLHLPPSTRAFKNALPVSLEFEPEISPNRPLLRLVSVHSPNVVNSFYSNPSSSPPLSTIPTLTVSLDNILFCPLLYSVSALSFLSRPLT
ncbi:hypothetical protein F5H01DRAFT_7736 [Linnemannia elongata]|nr:hypothetical protein F5H01DRAFT_7736 [Linnemannia elongata]